MGIAGISALCAGRLRPFLDVLLHERGNRARESRSVDLPGPRVERARLVTAKGRELEAPATVPTVARAYQVCVDRIRELEAPATVRIQGTSYTSTITMPRVSSALRAWAV